MKREPSRLRRGEERTQWEIEEDHRREGDCDADAMLAQTLSGVSRFALDAIRNHFVLRKLLSEHGSAAKGR